MKTMTLTQIGLLTLALTLSASALAERGSQERQQSMQRYEQLKDLSADQREALQALKDESSAVREARQAAMQERVNAILTEEQQAQLQERKGERMQKNSNRGKDCDMRGANNAERQEMRQEMRQEQRQGRQS